MKIEITQEEIDLIHKSLRNRIDHLKEHIQICKTLNDEQLISEAEANIDATLKLMKTLQY